MFIYTLKSIRMETNELYPVFLKVNELNILIVGGGNVGLEKLTFLLKSSLALMLKLFPTFLRTQFRLPTSINQLS